MSVSLLGMSLAFAVAGVLQSYLERVQGQPYMVAQQPMRFWMFIAFVHGAGRPRRRGDDHRAPAHAEASAGGVRLAWGLTPTPLKNV